MLFMLQLLLLIKCGTCGEKLVEANPKLLIAA